jgi:hypothetical protein
MSIPSVTPDLSTEQVSELIDTLLETWRGDHDTTSDLVADRKIRNHMQQIMGHVWILNISHLARMDIAEVLQASTNLPCPWWPSDTSGK